MKLGPSLSLTLTVAALALAAASAPAQSPHTHQHSFGDAKKWSKIFDDPARDAWQKPHEVIRALGLKPDAVVADIGAGTGYFAVRLAHMLPRGRVYAVDTEAAMVKHVEQRAKGAGLANVTGVHAAAGDPKLPEKADLILLVDVYHHVEGRVRYFEQVAAVLKAGGRLAIVDFRMDSPHGPPQAARVEPSRVKSELAAAGYDVAQEHAFLPYQYFIVFQRSGR